MPPIFNNSAPFQHDELDQTDKMFNFMPFSFLFSGGGGLGMKMELVDNYSKGYVEGIHLISLLPRLSQNGKLSSQPYISLSFFEMEQSFSLHTITVVLTFSSVSGHVCPNVPLCMWGYT